MRSRMMLRVSLAPETRSLRGALDGRAIDARRSNLLPLGNGLGAVRQHRAGGMTNETLRYGTEHQAIERRLTVGSDDEEVGVDIARQLRNLDIRLAQANVKVDPFDGIRNFRCQLCEPRADVVGEVGEAHKP